MQKIIEYCKCGCGQKLPEKNIIRQKQPAYIKRFKEIGFINGHQSKGHKQWKWNNGKSRTSNGYIDIKMPEHPFATKRGHVSEHRLIMEKHIGRYLEPNEEVHHLNGIRDDNKIENLVILKKGQHTSLHHKGKKCHPNSKMTREKALKGWDARHKKQR